MKQSTKQSRLRLRIYSCRNRFLRNGHVTYQAMQMYTGSVKTPLFRTPNELKWDDMLGLQEICGRVIFNQREWDSQSIKATYITLCSYANESVVSVMTAEYFLSLLNFSTETPCCFRGEFLLLPPTLLKRFVSSVIACWSSFLRCYCSPWYLLFSTSITWLNCRSGSNCDRVYGAQSVTCLYL